MIYATPTTVVPPTMEKEEYLRSKELTLEEYFRRLQVEEPELDSYIPEIDEPRAKQVGGKHYHQGNGIQPWDIIEAWELDFWEGNVVKYILRWKHKDGVQDLEKARHYLDYIISKNS